MNLHRALAHEWTDIPAGQQNSWQRLATRTHGTVTPGNIISVIGFLLVIAGSLLFLTDSQLAGLALILIGRFADLLDGFIANATGTKSPVGEAVDAFVDKLGALIVLIAITVTGYLPVVAAGLILLNNLGSVGVFALARQRNGRVHPTAVGKIGTALEWLAVPLFVGAHAYDATYSYLLIIAWLTLTISLIMGVVATVQYVKQYRQLG
jgi:phosphatidylglycerophosphate synthase